MTTSANSKVRFGSAVRWAAIMSWGQDGLAAAATFILALILGPKDFGLVSVGMSYIGIFEMFAAQGLVTAVVQSRHVDDGDLDHIFWYAVGCGAVLALIAAGSSGMVSAFFGIAALGPIVLVLAVGILIRSLTIVHEAKLIRDMNFRVLATRMNFATAVSVVAGISAAFAGWGAWALVAQWLVKVAGVLIGLWGAAGWRPRFRVRSERGRELISFSWKTFPATLLDYATSQTEPIVMGKLFGEVAVGIYRLASRLMELVISIVTRALWHVSFPYLAEAKGDEAMLRERIGTCLRYSLLFCMPVVALLALESPMLVHLMGQEWADAVPVIRVLCAYAVIRAVILFNGPLLLARGWPRSFSVVVGVQCITTIASVVIAANMLSHAAPAVQLSGIAWARFVAYAVVSLPVLAYLVIVSVRMPMDRLRSVVVPALVVTVSAFGLDFAFVETGEMLGVPAIAAFAFRVVVVGAATAGLVLWVDQSIRQSVSDWARRSKQAPVSAGEE